MSEPLVTPRGSRAIVGGVALLVLLAAGPVSAATYGDIEIGVLNEPRDHPTHGYTDYRFIVRHKGTTGKRVVRLAIPGTSYSVRTGNIQSVSRAFEIEAGKVVTASLLVPARPEIYGNGAAVWIDGQKQESTVPLSLASGRGGRSHHFGGRTDILVYYSQRVPENFFNTAVRGVAPAIAAPPPGMPPPAGPGAGAAGGAVPGGEDPDPAIGGIMGGPAGGLAPGAPVFYLSGQQVRADSPISNWSRQWLGYSRFDGIIVTSEDLAELARAGNDGATILQALRQYTEAGGAMVVLGPGKVDLPASWTRMKLEHISSRNSTAFLAASVVGSHSPCPLTVAAVAGCAVRFPTPLYNEIFSAGFGRCIITPDRDSATWKSERWAQFEDAWAGTARSAQSGRTMLDLNTTLPVVEEMGVPVRGLFVLMALFSFAIGPINLWMLTKWKRRIWLLWTVPAMSSLTCLAVLGYMVLAEGWQGHAQVAGLTFLDETERRATTIGRCAFYSPLTPSDGLHFSIDTEVMPSGHEHAVYSNSCAVDWTVDQHLIRGWVSARVPSHFTMRKSELRREDIKVHREGNSLVLINRLGADIKKIIVADEKGQLHRAESIAAGEKTVLDPMAGQLTTKPNAWRMVYGSPDWVTAMKDVMKKPEQYLIPRSYLAVVDGAPFLEQGLRGARERPTESVVLGLMGDGK